MHRQRNFLVMVTLAAAAATPALGQPIVPTVDLADSGAHGAASIPDFSGPWSHPSWPGFEPPLSGPGPVLNKSRRRQIVGADRRPLPATNAPLVSGSAQMVGDYTNPILKPPTGLTVRLVCLFSLGTDMVREKAPMLGRTFRVNTASTSANGPACDFEPHPAAIAGRQPS
jgi:hypothetical protein